MVAVTRQHQTVVGRRGAQLGRRVAVRRCGWARAGCHGGPRESRYRWALRGHQVGTTPAAQSSRSVAWQRQAALIVATALQRRQFSSCQVREPRSDMVPQLVVTQGGRGGVPTSDAGCCPSTRVDQARAPTDMYTDVAAGGALGGRPCTLHSSSNSSLLAGTRALGGGDQIHPRHSCQRWCCVVAVPRLR